MDILVIGSGSRAKVVLDAVMRAGEHRVVGMISEGRVREEEIMGVPVLGRLEDLPGVAARMGLMHGVTAIDDIGQRMSAAQRVHNILPSFSFITVIDPAALVSTNVEIGVGSVVLAGARLEPGVSIGEHAFVGSLAIVGADTSLGGFTNLGAGAAIGEASFVGGGTAVGINACVVQKMIIGTHCVIGAGAVVLESVPDLHVAIGVPAKCVRTRLVGESYS